MRDVVKADPHSEWNVHPGLTVHVFLTPTDVNVLLLSPAVYQTLEQPALLSL